jgi:hypothetical protein
MNGVYNLFLAIPTNSIPFGKYCLRSPFAFSFCPLVKRTLIKLLAEDSPKMQYIIQWIKGEVSFSNLSEQEQNNVIKYINTPIQGN